MQTTPRPEGDSGPEPFAAHVCHVVLRLGVGGMENGLVHLLRSDPLRAFRHTVLCLEDAGPLAERLAGTSVTVLTLPPAGRRYPWSTHRRVYTALRSLRPDLVHTRNVPTCDLPMIAKLAGARAVIHSEHGLEERELRGGVRRYVWIRRLSRPFVDEYIALGRPLADWVVQEIGVRQDRIHAVYNGVDTDAFCPRPPGTRAALRRELLPAGWPDDALVLGTAGRFSRVKNLDVLIAAFASLRGADAGRIGRARLLLVGDGPERDGLTSLIESQGLTQTVAMTGFNDRVPDYLACMDLFVLPSHSEGVSNTLLEAQAAGLPVVTTAVGSSAELVVDGESGLLVAADDIPVLAAAIGSLLADCDRMTRFGDRARRHVSTKFTWERAAADYERVYRLALGLKTESG